MVRNCKQMFSVERTQKNEQREWGEHRKKKTKQNTETVCAIWRSDFATKSFFDSQFLSIPFHFISFGFVLISIFCCFRVPCYFCPVLLTYFMINNSSFYSTFSFCHFSSLDFNSILFFPRVCVSSSLIFLLFIWCQWRNHDTTVRFNSFDRSFFAAFCLSSSLFFCVL